MAKHDELVVALRDLLREVRKISDVCLPDGFDARAVRNAEAALAVHDGVPGPDGSRARELTELLQAAMPWLEMHRDDEARELGRQVREALRTSGVEGRKP